MKIQETFPIVSRNLQRLWKEKTFVLLIALLLFILLSMSILISVVVFLFNPQYLTQEDIKVAILTDNVLPTELFDSRDIDFIEHQSIVSARLAFENHSVDAIIYDETYLEEKIVTQPQILELIVTEDPLQQSLVLSLLKPQLESAESQLQNERDVIPNAIWQSEVRFSTRLLQGTDTIYEAILSLMIPLMLLIPIFLIGNLFVDSVSQEFEEGAMENILVTISPLRYVYEHIIEAVMLNGALTIAFLALINLRFGFIQNEVLVFIYTLSFLFPIVLLALLVTFMFKKKEVGQLIYSFSILAIFLLSPFTQYGPTYIITELLLGRTDLFLPGIAIIFASTVILFGGLKYYLNKEYYV